MSKRMTVVALMLAGCGGGGQAVERANAPQDSAVRMDPPKKSVYIRASFDGDPSPFIGRFLPAGTAVGDIDENAAAQTRCSKFITYDEVKAGGSFDEVFNASTDVSASLGFVAVGQASLAAGQNAGVRVRYTLDKKMRATIKDPDGLDQCCKAAADQCSDLMVGEFLSGTGEVYQFAGSEAGLQAGGMLQGGGTGDFDFKNGVAWKRASKFDGMYFAFRTQAARLGGDSMVKADPADCSWADSVPNSLDGTYFVGMSPPVASEATARDKAQQNAQVQAVRYLGQFIQTSTQTKSSALAGYLEDEEKIATVAQGLTRRLKAEKFCKPEAVETPDGLLYTSKVLVFFPKSEEKAAAQTAVDVATADLEKTGKLSKKAKAELEQVKAGLAQ